MTRRLVLWDLDGTLADDRHRIQYALDKNWVEYYAWANIVNDAVHPEGREAFFHELNQPDTYFGYLTGRREDVRIPTTEWLEAQGFPQSKYLIMRQFSQPSTELPLANLKAKTVEQLLATGKYSEVVLFDDDPEVFRVVTEQHGPGSAVHCTWYIKEKALVRAAIS